MPTLDEQLTDLRERWKPLGAIKLIQAQLGLPPHLAKQYLHDHPAWHDALTKWDESLDDAERQVADEHG